jgi:hypothetical protein
MANATLQAIRDKVRLLTRSPSPAQLSDTQIDQYVNTFILYDFPESIRLFSLRTTLTFYTQPNVEVYSTNTTTSTDPLYNFKNRYTAVHAPVYVAGVMSFYTQDRASFYLNWPMTNLIADTGLTGNGTTGPYIGTLTSANSAPVMQNNVVFTTTDALGNAMTLVDTPASNLLGTLGVPGAPSTVYGAINYITGVFNLNFPSTVSASTKIWSETIPYQAARPISMLFYQQSFHLRPIPDKAYAVTIEADVRPTELLLATDVPGEEQWWQYVAYGAAIKIFQDRMDMDSVQLVWHEFERQQCMAARPSICQEVNERTKTVYTQGKIYGAGWFMNSWPY